ncbi:MAG: hypothetical protein ACD_5C00019G0003 [uncultured bacterium]|nr:MAG: hypothetical protein ACD_5C00019G0003 [uncultured bacterium]
MRSGYLSKDPIINAFAKIHRFEFVPDDLAQQAEADIPLPIGFGQTISQPSTVAFMLELLDPAKDQKILDVGSGSGWTTALLSFIVGEKGTVVAIEKIKDLCDFGKKNVDKFHFVSDGIAQFHCLSAEEGFDQMAPYDRILVSASVDHIPQAFKDQLALGGKMVIPVHNEIWYVEKKSSEEFEIEKFPGFAFVPFVIKTSKY